MSVKQVSRAHKHAAPVEPRYLTLDQAADLTGCSKSTVRRLIDAGQLEAVYFSPRTMRIPVSAIHALAAKNSTAVAGGAY